MEYNPGGITFQEEKKTEGGGYLKNHQLVFMQWPQYQKKQSCQQDLEAIVFK